MPAILGIPYGVTQGKLLSRPRPVLQYRGESSQVLAGLAFGPDGLYFAPMMPNEDGMSAVLKYDIDLPQSILFISRKRQIQLCSCRRAAALPATA